MQQWGEWSPDVLFTDPPRDCARVRRDGSLVDLSTSAFLSDPAVAELHRNGKKAAGRLLDGVEWSEFPTVRAAAGVPG